MTDLLQRKHRQILAGIGLGVEEIDSRHAKHLLNISKTDEETAKVSTGQYKVIHSDSIAAKNA